MSQSVGKPSPSNLIARRPLRSLLTSFVSGLARFGSEFAQAEGAVDGGRWEWWKAFNGERRGEGGREHSRRRCRAVSLFGRLSTLADSELGQESDTARHLSLPPCVSLGHSALFSTSLRLVLLRSCAAPHMKPLHEPRMSLAQRRLRSQGRGICSHLIRYYPNLSHHSHVAEMVFALAVPLSSSVCHSDHGFPRIFPNSLGSLPSTPPVNIVHHLSLPASVINVVFDRVRYNTASPASRGASCHRAWVALSSPPRQSCGR